MNSIPTYKQTSKPIELNKLLSFLLSPQNPNKNKFESKEEEGRGMYRVRRKRLEFGLVKVSKGPTLRCGRHPWASSM